MRPAVAIVLAVLVLSALPPAARAQQAGVPTCTWLFAAFEGVPLTAALAPNYNNSGAPCPGLMSFAVSPLQDPASVAAGTSFAFGNLRQSNFSITPPLGRNNYQLAVNVVVKCQVVNVWCNPGVVYFWVRPSGLTPAPTAAPSTGVPTPQPTAAPSTAAPTPLPPGQTSAPLTDVPSLAPPTPVPTAVPVPQLPVTCPSPLPVGYSYIAQPVRFDILSGVQNCIAPSLAIAPDPLNAAIGLWTVNTTDNNTLYFDASGNNTVQAIFNVAVNVNCGGVTYCVVSQQLVVSAPITSAPAPVLADCPQAYGFQTFFGQTQALSLSAQDFAFQCSDNTTVASYANVSTTAVGILSAFDPASGNFTYAAPSNLTIDSFRFVVACSGIPACGGQAFLVTNMNVPIPTAAPPTAAPTTAAPPGPNISTPVPLGTLNPQQQWQPCPGASPFIFTFFRNNDQSFSTQSANVFTGGTKLTYPCSVYGNLTLLSNPAVGQLAYFDAVSGQFWYTSASAVNGWDNFTFGLSCVTPSPFTCIATAMIMVFPAASGTTPAPTPMPTMPQPFASLNQGTIQCRGTCDADAWKSTNEFPTMFDTTPDMNGGYSHITPRKDGNAVGSAQYTLSAVEDNVVILSFYTKIGNMAVRFPTFFPFDVPNRNRFTSDAAMGSGAAFNMTCLNLQTSARGLALGMWQWDNNQLLNLSGRIVNNSLYNRGNDYFQKFGGKHKNCDVFASNPCQYAPMLTPNIPGQPMSADRLASYINWTLTVDDCDATWIGTLNLTSIKAMAYADGTNVFQRVSPKELRGTLYSEVVMPKSWVRPSSGTYSSSNAINVTILVRTYLTASAGQIDSVNVTALPTAAPAAPATPAPSTDVPTTATPSAAPLAASVGSGSGSGAGTASLSPLTTSGSTGFATTSAAPQNTAGSGSGTSAAPSSAAPQAGSGSGAAANVTAAVTTTFLPPPPPSVAPATGAPLPVPAGPLPLVNLSVDVEYNIDTNANGERIYLYNLLLYPLFDPLAAANVSFATSGLFVANVQLVSAIFTAPTASRCPQCTGSTTSCVGTGVGFADRCGPQALVTFAPTNASGVAWCPNTTAPLVDGVVPPRTCPQTLYNISFVGTVSGSGSWATAGQPSGTIIVNITLSNGQVFGINVNQNIYISQASTNSDMTITVSRPTTYYTVADPTGTSLPTKPWKVPKPDDAPELNYRSAAASAATCPAAFTPPFIDFKFAAPFGGASMTEQPDARIFGPTDWVFLQLNTKALRNASLQFMTLAVDAAEVIPRPSQQQFAFLLQGANPPPATAAMGGVYLDWAVYASFLSFRAIDTMAGTRPMQFGFVPGQLLRAGCSPTVVFRVEAVVSVGGMSYFIRLKVPVSQNVQRPGVSLKDQYYGDLAASLAQSLAGSNSPPNFTMYVLVVAGLLLLTFVVAAKLDPTLVPGLALQVRIFLGALHIVDMPLKPRPPASPSAMAQQRQQQATAAAPGGDAGRKAGGQGARPPSLQIAAISLSTNQVGRPLNGAAPSGQPVKFGVIQTELSPRRDWQDEVREVETLPRKDDEERALTPKK